MFVHMLFSTPTTIDSSTGTIFHMLHNTVTHQCCNSPQPGRFKRGTRAKCNFIYSCAMTTLARLVRRRPLVHRPLSSTLSFSVSFSPSLYNEWNHKSFTVVRTHRNACTRTHMDAYKFAHVPQPNECIPSAIMPTHAHTHCHTSKSARLCAR